MLRARLISFILQGVAFALALAFTSGILLLTGTSPLEAGHQVLLGSFGSIHEFAYVLRNWIPLLLVTAGLLITFSAGLWNIGAEGQITMGAIFTTWALRVLQDAGLPPGAVIALGLVAGVIGGMVWSALAGGLKTYGGVHEIFGGLGLNFVATAVALWLIFGPWKRPGVGSMSGTQPFPEALWMRELSVGHVSPWALALAVAGIVCVGVIFRNTLFGLKLKAVGKNAVAAFRLGVPTSRYVMSSFILCGALAGLAGALQVTAVYHRLIPSISSGYGFIGLMIALLIGFRARWAAPVVLFFAAVNVGSIQLPIALQLDSSLSGVLQGLLVLFVLMAEGARKRWIRSA